MPSFLESEVRCRTTYDPLQKIWSGIRAKPAYGPNCSIGEAVLTALLAHPEDNRQICHHNGRIYTNQNIAILSIRIAQHFQALGVLQSEIIGIVSGNTDYVAPLVIGAMLCGLTICPMDRVLDKDIIKSAFAQTRPKYIFTVLSEYEKVSECSIELDLNAQIFTLNGARCGVSKISEFLEETGSEMNFKPPALQLGYNQVAAIVRSSGTTGVPKAVCLTHASLLNHFRPKNKKNTGYSIFLHNTTIYWISGLARFIGNCLHNITTIINETEFESSSIPEILKKYKVQSIYSTPHLLIDILALPNIEEIDFSSLRRFATGGCSLPYALIEKAKKYMPRTQFHIVYGTTEACGAITSGICNPENHVGQLITNMDIKIINDLNMNVGIDEIGEICTRSIFPWPGYYNNPDKTKAVYRDGWIYSGDLGYINGDGNLFIVDRKKDIIEYLGQQIHPNELEMIIAEIMDVEDVCVCGLPDDLVGHLPAAVVCKSRGSELTSEEIVEYVGRRVDVDYKRLRGGVYFENFIPKTVTGKKLRHRATNICEYKRRMQPNTLPCALSIKRSRL